MGELFEIDRRLRSLVKGGWEGSKWAAMGERAGVAGAGRIGGNRGNTILFRFPTSRPPKISRASSLWPTSSKASVAS